jgi:hypothetical protein
MKNRVLSIVVVSAAVATAGCFGFERKSSLTGPSAVGVGALMGNWTSSNIIPSPTTCTDFKWNVTEQTTTTAKGSFSATCAGELKFTGTAEGKMTGNSISWTANGKATGPGLPSCDIALVGTAELTVDSIRVPYSGTTCLGPVNGVENLRRQ